MAMNSKALIGTILINFVCDLWEEVKDEIGYKYFFSLNLCELSENLKKSLCFFQLGYSFVKNGGRKLIFDNFEEELVSHWHLWFLLNLFSLAKSNFAD